MKFLEERLKTILEQTFSNWECIVIDGFSVDGTFEFLKEKTAGDKRFKFFQFPPKGVYDAWNKGIEKCLAEYIYIATSDDTMSPNALERMYTGLINNPECGIAHCKLDIIDEQGNSVDQGQNWTSFKASPYFSGSFDKDHIRQKGLDFVLFGFAGNVYTSFTQLLIKKELFTRIGTFRTNVRSIADLLWNHEATVYTPTLHVAETLVTWRIHKDQATQADFLDSSEHREILCDNLNKCYYLAVGEGIVRRKFLQAYRYLRHYRIEQFYIEYFSRKNVSFLEKLSFFGRWFFKRPEIVFGWFFFRSWLEYKSPFDISQRSIELLTSPAES